MLQVQSKYASTILSNFKYAKYTIYNNDFAYAFAHKKIVAPSQRIPLQRKKMRVFFKHMKITSYNFPDADKDGITDQFDKEPNTT